MFGALEATREAWGLGPLPPANGALLLVGWSRQLAFAADDEPAPFAAILATALTRLGPLAFPASERLGAAGAVYAPWAPRRRPLMSLARSALCLTSDVALAAKLFDDGAFPWPLQGQFGLLCEKSVKLEALAALAGMLDGLIEPGWSAALPALNAAGVAAVLRPGTDGDVAGLLAADAALHGRVVASLAETARQSAVAFEMLDEAGFAAALAAS
jgi:hypothetical protein